MSFEKISNKLVDFFDSFTSNKYLWQYLIIANIVTISS